MEEITLESRELTGKKAKRLYHENIVPAVIFNREGKSENVQAQKGEIESLLQTATISTVVTVKYDGESKKCLIKEVDIEPTKSIIRHIGFFEIDENEIMSFEIPINLVGISPAVKNSIGVLVQPTNSVLVRCKLADLVDSIEIDISHLELPGQSVSMKDVELPEGTELPNEEQLEKPLAIITQLQKLVEVEEEVEEVEGEEGEEGVEGAEGEEGAEGAEDGESTETSEE